jgi:pyrroloquinoline-quinone synthase
MALLERIDAEIQKRSLLKHDFYVMWSEGKLTKDDLAGYSREYFQLVKVVPSLVRNISSFSEANGAEEYALNLKDEISHVQLWKGFAAALGVELDGYSGSEKTRRAVSNLVQLSKRSFYEGAAAMYAFEKQIPEISRTKMDGLSKFYGIDSREATEYFRVHKTDDVRHAAVWQAALSNAPKKMETAIAEAATESLAAQNELLDSVMDQYVRKTSAV